MKRFNPVKKRSFFDRASFSFFFIYFSRFFRTTFFANFLSVLVARDRVIKTAIHRHTLFVIQAIEVTDSIVIDHVRIVTVATSNHILTIHVRDRNHNNDHYHLYHLQDDGGSKHHRIRDKPMSMIHLSVHRYRCMCVLWDCHNCHRQFPFSFIITIIRNYHVHVGWDSVNMITVRVDHVTKIFEPNHVTV